MDGMTNRLLSVPRWASYSLATFGIAVLTAILIPLREHINSTTIGFAFLLVVLSVAIILGKRTCLACLGPGNAVLQLLFSSSLLHFHNCRSAELGCSHCILRDGARRGSAFSQSKAPRRRS